MPATTAWPTHQESSSVFMKTIEGMPAKPSPPICLEVSITLSGRIEAPMEINFEGFPANGCSVYNAHQHVGICRIPSHLPMKTLPFLACSCEMTGCAQGGMARDETMMLL